MTETQIDHGRIAFQTEGRLLQELGERLVARAEVALVELIKNAYDADASFCQVTIVDHSGMLEIRDDGSGMSFEQFTQRWMRIATSHKVQERVSTKYRRHLTGQKGIGRFAVRFLGRTLRLDTVAWDERRQCRTRLTADFDWEALDAKENLVDAKIPYRLLRVEPTTPTGTTLSIRHLKNEATFAKSSEFRTSVLKIVSPVAALESGRFARSELSTKKDPGFQVRLPGDSASSGQHLDLGREVLAHAWAQLAIDLRDDVLTYAVKFHDQGKTERLRIRLRSYISGGLLADIRFFPRRSGIFRGAEVNGREAWRWVRENHGVAVIDHGFRIPPYGLEDDDWLMLDADSAHNERDWRSDIAHHKFPIPDEIRGRGENPMLNLPSNFQLVGAVFVESSSIVSGEAQNLIPAMDREGFLHNDAFDQMFDIVRGGTEFLAFQDRLWLQREDERRAKEAARQARADLKAAVKYIENSPTLARADKARLVKEYTGLARKITEVEQYDREARRKLETMSALGVVAGFMTHEASAIMKSLGDALRELRRLARKHPTIRQNIDEIEQSYVALEAHLQYTKTFIDATQKGEMVPFKAGPQIRYVLSKFGDFARNRGIVVEIDIDNSLEAPRMPIAVYSGVVLNLYTNALKAILALKSAAQSRIVFRGSNETKWHVLEVLDTGIGIPPELRNRVWDPLFTTTSRLDSPLGSGMGLGLTLVRDLVHQIGGRITIVDPPVGFSTCFRVQFPRN